MAGIERRCAHHFQCFRNVQSALYIIDQTLHVDQCGMSFVAVVNLFGDAQFFQHQHTADTEHNLLFQTIFPIAAIELVRDGTIPLAVHLHVGVEQIERHAPYSHAPNVGIHRTSGIRHFDHQRLAIFVLHLRDGQTVEVLRLVVGHLLTVHRQRLCKVTVAIEETDGRHVDIAVGRLFQVVAGQNTQTSRIDFQVVGQAVFHAEIGHRRFFRGRFRIDVSAKFGINVV